MANIAAGLGITAGTTPSAPAASTPSTPASTTPPPVGSMVQVNSGPTAGQTGTLIALTFLSDGTTPAQADVQLTNGPIVRFWGPSILLTATS